MYLTYIVSAVKSPTLLITHFVLLVGKYIVHYLLIKSKLEQKYR